MTVPGPAVGGEHARCAYGGLAVVGGVRRSCAALYGSGPRLSWLNTLRIAAQVSGLRRLIHMIRMKDEG